jgi:hypothetical protein
VTSSEFYPFLLNNLSVFLMINFFTFLFLFLSFRSLLFNGVLNPLFIIVVVGFSTKYAILIFLYMFGLIDQKYMVMFLTSLIVFVVMFRLSFHMNVAHFIWRGLALSRRGKFEFKIALLLYLLISIFIIYKIGLGLFSDTNRFENNRGFGAFVRLLDLFSVFIISYLCLFWFKLAFGFKKICFTIFVFVFVVFSAILNGAKISFLFNILVLLFAYRIHYPSKRIKIKTIFLVVLIGSLFILMALRINLEKNGIDVTAMSNNIEGVPLLVDKLIHRMVSNGNTVYLLLPDNVIEKIDIDNIFVRLLTPVIGITQMSNLLGYNAGDFSVGRQALLYFDPDAIVAGGPTSHFDMFSYVYLGVFGGLLFVIILAFTLGGLNGAIYKYSKCGNKTMFLSAFYTTLWFRFCVVLVEPPIGFAYLIDAVLIIGSLVVLNSLLNSKVRINE